MIGFLTHPMRLISFVEHSCSSSTSPFTCVLISCSKHFTFLCCRIFHYHHHPLLFRFPNERNSLLDIVFCFLLITSMHLWAPTTQTDRIMLRFRPIAPKPTASGAVSGTADQGRETVAGRRVKRKYLRVRGRQGKRCAKTKSNGGGKQPPSPPAKSGVEDAPPPEKGAATLKLLGEMRSGSDQQNSIPRSPENENWKADADGASNAKCGGSVMMKTWIIVECVTDKYAGAILGFSDKEKIHNLEQDTCPGFVSDWTNNVIWANQAYKEMVAEDETAAEKGLRVWLVVKEQLPHICPSFACRVRVTQQKGQGQKWNKIVPCDVWRMEFGGFAWKLDVNTALSLGY